MANVLSFPAAALALAMTGCAVVTATPPSVDVMNLRLVGIGLPEQQLVTTFCVTNPNANQIAFRGVTVMLDVSGSPLATGTSNVPVILPPLSSTAVPFTVMTTVQNLGPQLLGILSNGNLDYRMHGTASL